MKFKIMVKNEISEWSEVYDENIEDPKLWAEEIISRFNRTLKPMELPRELIGVELLDDDNSKFHEWVKHTGGMSVNFRGMAVDMMYCSKCGITGKRLGLGGHIKIDSKYRNKLYRNCSRAKEEIRFRENL